ncbi:hypothetical protein ACIBL3_22890 [Kribbella sp. NPDC050124]|uniref:hypothetical protein n=1 Tax=Kribbella sp. NPDC050124 TaxID=3364114 RepID=UPI003789D6AD
MIEKAFQDGAKKHALPDFLRVEINEEAEPVRASVAFPPDLDQLVTAPAKTVVAFRFARNLTIDPIGDGNDALRENAHEFGDKTSAHYISVVLLHLVSEAGSTPGLIPDERELADRADKLGPPCRLIAGRKIFRQFEKWSDDTIEKVKHAHGWPDTRALLMSTRSGPWIEQLETTFDLSWMASDGDPKIQKVDLTAARRLYINNPKSGYRYG